MNIEQLHQYQMGKLVKAFGVANAMSVFRDDRASRAFGNHYSEQR